MTQKSNPLSLRLGILQLWTSSFQNYGNTLKLFPVLISKQLKIKYYLENFFNSNNHLINYKEFCCDNQTLFCNIYFTKISQISVTYFHLKKITQVLTYWYNKNLILRFYYKSNWFYSIDFLMLYITYLHVKLTYSLKKIFMLLISLFAKLTNYKKISFLRIGFKKIQVKGFKIQVKGRFENTKNQMAKTINYKFGSLSLVNLENNVYYRKNCLNTKLGSCTVHVWLFYKILS